MTMTMPDYIEREAAKAVLNERYRIRTHMHDMTSAAQLKSAELEIGDIPAADVRPVVLCRDCKWWAKQEASLQGRCELLQMYPTGAWFCANGKREESR